MDEFQEIVDSLVFQIGAFIAGLIVGTYVFANEMALFIENLVMDALFHTLPQSAASTSIFESYTTAIAMLTFVGIVQGILIGIFFIEAFSFGYIFGDFFLVILVGGILWDIAPSVVIGMIVAGITVFIGLYIRLLIKNRRNYYQRNYHW
jgi:hypothetical protein